MIDDTMVVCFESHLIARLGLPPSKFLVAVMGFLRCELVHLNPNPIATLSYFGNASWGLCRIPACSGIYIS
jgi:hypothetical protein